MKKIIGVLAILMLLSACSSYVTTPSTPGQLQNSANISQAQMTQAPIVEGLVPIFKITSQEGVRYTNPPVIKGTLLNAGNGTGNARIIGRIYYSGVIAYENSIIIPNIAPEESVNFTIPINQTLQWTSYTVVAEVSS